METNGVLIVGIILSLVIGAGAIFIYYKKRNLDAFFSQVYEQAKQAPKQKKNSFLLLLFKESLMASKKKSNKSSFANKFQNPKYLEIQLVQMSHILKDTSKVQDKTIKKSLNLLKNYKAWEKAKMTKDTKVVQGKAS
ncbi:hypothetical protein Amet_1389 [Alkaliphilus metalliredigens QYMF]|uniref:Uncharacterized protein n=1 Tax=Alkaliphilus metalliredigens (strain QYMF) TaxID=293826 RepID=A6TN21_ALKMQ|nr:hypothetical protein [Alkaliphilus metalliredigens]ABR47589.1 hypothetical protein Amet_1389 [Alkaliphilus metalliredigens QYMF]